MTYTGKSRDKWGPHITTTRREDVTHLKADVTHLKTPQHKSQGRTMTVTLTSHQEDRRGIKKRQRLGRGGEKGNPKEGDTGARVE